MKRLLVVVTLIVCAPLPVHAAETTIVVLHQDAVAADERRLIDALRIYTRDLDASVVAAGDAPAVLDSYTVEVIAAKARAENAEVVLWAQRRRNGARAYYMWNVATREIRETEMAPIGSERAAVEVALKVRAFLSGRRVTRPATSRAQPSDENRVAPLADSGQPLGAEGLTDVAAAPGATPGGEDAKPAAAPSPPSSIVPQPATSSTIAATRPGAAPGSVSPSLTAARFSLAGGFHIASPTDPTWARTGILVSAAVRVGSPTSRFWLYLDGAFTSRPRSQVRGVDLSLSDLPIGAGIQAVWSARRVGAAVGSRTSFHVFDVDAVANDGRTGAARRYALGLGGLARGHLSVVNHVSMTLTVSVEGLVPTQEFTIAGESAMGTGSVLFGATVGVAISLP